MSDKPRPPPLPPILLHPSRTRSQRETLLKNENAQLRADLEAERALVEVLRNQPTTPQLRAQEDTLPGIGRPQRYKGSIRARKRASGRLRLGKWGFVIGSTLALAAQLASLLYPRLMGPIELVQKAFEALQ